MGSRSGEPGRERHLGPSLGDAPVHLERRDPPAVGGPPEHVVAPLDDPHRTLGPHGPAFEQDVRERGLRASPGVGEEPELQDGSLGLHRSEEQTVDAPARLLSGRCGEVLEHGPRVRDRVFVQVLERAPDRLGGLREASGADRSPHAFAGRLHEPQVQRRPVASRPSDRRPPDRRPPDPRGRCARTDRGVARARGGQQRQDEHGSEGGSSHGVEQGTGRAARRRGSEQGTRRPFALV